MSGKSNINIDKIITKTGDTGKAWSCNGMQSKSDKWFMVIGDIDELNACIGIAAYGMKQMESRSANVDFKQLQDEITKLQGMLFDIGGDLFSNSNKITQDYVVFVEKLCEKYKPTPIDSFVLPAGASSYWHLARAVCRRAERSFWGFFEDCCANAARMNSIQTEVDAEVDSGKYAGIDSAQGLETDSVNAANKVNTNNKIANKFIGVGLNRLSDLLFIFSRLVNNSCLKYSQSASQTEKMPEEELVLWKPYDIIK